MTVERVVQAAMNNSPRNTFLTRGLLESLYERNHARQDRATAVTWDTKMQYAHGRDSPPPLSSARMSAPVQFLDFFVLEASDYIDQLDALLLQGGGAGPHPDALQRQARALRGSATMARLATFSELAGGIERVGRAMREGRLQWDPGLSGAVVSAVDDCKVLLRNVRVWSGDDDRRARARIVELERHAPARQETPAAPAAAGPDDYLANETSNVGAGLELLATRPNDRDAAANVLRRARALRGIAGVKDHAALADVLEAAEQAAQPLELGDGPLSAERVALLGAAATVLRGVAGALRAGTSGGGEADLARFAAALDAMRVSVVEMERIVPIAHLFFEDGGPTLVEASAHPPTSPAERFRLEVVSQGEHLRRLVADARAAHDSLSRDRVARALRQALGGLRLAAESFGERELADFVALHAGASAPLDSRALDSLDEVASLLAQPGASPAPLGERLDALKQARRASAEREVIPAAERAESTAPAPAVPVAPPAAPPAPAPPRPSVPMLAVGSDPATLVGESLNVTPAMTPFTSHRPIPAPSAPPQERDRPAAAEVAHAVSDVPTAIAPPSLDELLGRGIERLGALGDSPLSAPRTLAEQPVISIDKLLYRGRAAIERCCEIRDDARASTGTVDGEALEELMELLDLALTD